MSSVLHQSPNAKKGSELDSTLPFLRLVAGAGFELMTFTAELMKSEPDELFCFWVWARFMKLLPVVSPLRGHRCGDVLKRLSCIFSEPTSPVLHLAPKRKKGK